MATVTPNGENGIVTAMSKGKATITAELNSEGKTITRTTNIKVASKARDTVLVLDISGSMRGNPETEMKKAATRFCDDLLKDEYNNRVGIVFYNSSVSTVDLSDDLDYLKSQINAINMGSTTNMEGGLSAADAMLQNQGKDDSIKNVVIMADGLPNEGKTSNSGSMQMPNNSFATADFTYANAVIDTAKFMMNRYNMYSLGFFHSLSGDSKDFSAALMQQLTNMKDGYHQVDKAEDLQFAFGDISENINIGSKIVINIACPVDVSVTYNGETLSSAESTYSDKASFGTLQLLGENKDIKVLSLDSDKKYDVDIRGTGEGTMDYSVNYFDENEKISDYRSFESVPIYNTTIINSNTDNSTNITLNVDNDGDGNIDTVWTAQQNSKGTVTTDNTPTTGATQPKTAEPTTTAAKEPENKSENTAGWLITVIVLFLIIFIIAISAVVVIISQKNKVEENYEIRIDKPNETNNVRDIGLSASVDSSEYGTIKILSGSMQGKTFNIKDGQMLYLGKDSHIANVALVGYKRVSRVHCSVTYNKKNQ